MFPTFGAAAQKKTSPSVSNPFAAKPTANPNGNTGNIKRKGRTPDNGNRGADERKKPTGQGRSNNVYSKHKKPRKPNESRALRTSVEFGTTDDSRATSPSSVSSTDMGIDVPSQQPEPSNATAAVNMADPHARNVYNRLRKDGISPPSWPSRPGDPASSAAMAKFREKYEDYRAQVRKSLTKAGLIDDPNKRRALKDAIEFKGISEDMCPEYEKITRITELDVQHAEKDPESNIPMTVRMVKKLARSAAGQEAPLPMDVRSVATLQRSLDYLIDDLLRQDGNLATFHGFLWDRTRAIRRDFTFFSTLTPDEIRTQVYVLENIARFHVTALHLLSQKDIRPEEFVEQQELEQLGKTLLSLRDLYDDCNAQGITCENEPEFRAYYLIFHARDPSILETLQRSWRPELWKDSDEVRTAVSLVESLQNTGDFHGPLKDGPSFAAAGAHHAYLRIVEDPSLSYTMACFAECHFPLVRRSILRSLARAMGRPKDEVKDVTAATLNRFLRFDTVDEAIEFAELHDLEFEADPADPLNPAKRRLILRHRQQLPPVRLSHQFSRKMVEKKRGSHSLPDVIHRTVKQDLSSVPSQEEEEEEEDSLFVSDSKPTATAPKSSMFGGTQPNSAPSPFSAPTGPSQPSGIFGGSNLSNGATASQSSQANPSPFGAISSEAQPVSNPFASAAPRPGDVALASNPFGSVPKPATAFGSQGLGPFAPNQDANQAKPATDRSKALETTRSSPFASAFQLKADSTTSSGTAFGATGSTFGFPKQGQATTTPAAADSSMDQGKATTPPASFFTPTTSRPQQQEPLPTPGLVPPPTLPNGAQENPSQGQSPGLFSFKPTTEQPPPAPPEVQSKTPTIPPIGSGTGEKKADTPQFSIGQAVSAPPGPSLLPPSAVMTADSPAPSPIQPTPQEDPMGDFAKWYVRGDGGLVEDFTVYIVDDILKGLYDKFVEEEEERARREEEQRLSEEVEAFRVYNLQVKFFYRWKKNARAKRLRYLRKNGREQFRAYYEAKREEEKRQAALREEEEREKARLAEVDRSKEVTMEIMRRKRTSTKRNREEQELLASGHLSGVGNEGDHAARIIHGRDHGRGRQSSTSRISILRPDRVAMPPPPSTRPSSPASSMTRKSGGKTQAIRDQLLQKKPEGFRRSLGSMSSRSSASPEPSRTTSNVSERWRLKAMGIVQMPDGTALPENLANEVLYGGKNYPGLGSSQRRRAASYTGTNGMPQHETAPTSDPRDRPWSIRRPSLLSQSLGASQQPHPQQPEHVLSPPSTNKRKRPGEQGAAADDFQEEEDSVMDREASPPKRPMNENQKLISELRAMREELEEGAAWFRSQTERMQTSRGNSRASTPWEAMDLS
ncbi:hypothetical protein GMORB2_4595 [Geosmithia morbida]|uniref:SAC3/GANP/THP3 conserved domain-containing protein n=1 Tax=Geosmithia morbida TaxID=1094350 RepID=A0A9P5D0Q6_9HYPO|nr:uncharacterized protein GMORB2_4595 [Geosmithia morbida]KAF4119686.1 hypothetical protein GMORB2_4595 [Geosmithia morbida]